MNTKSLNECINDVMNEKSSRTETERLLVHLQKTSYHLHRAATASVMRPVKPITTPRKRLGGVSRKQT